MTNFNRSHVRVFVMLLAALAVIGALSVMAKPALAQEAAQPPVPVREVTDDEVNAIAQKLYCPVCENITLDTCGTAACADWRYEIRLQLESGMTEDQIVADFVHRFGDRVVGTPMDPLLRALSLYTPWLIIAVAIIGTAVVLAKRRGGQFAHQTPTTNTPSTDGASGNRYQSLFEQDISST